MFIRPIAFFRNVDVVVGAVDFDEGDLLSRTGDLTGNTNGKKGIISFWYNRRSPTELRDHIWLTDELGGGLFVRYENDNKVRVQAQAPSAAVVLEMLSTIGPSAGEWHHILIAWDLSVPDQSHIFIDDVDVTSRLTHTDSNIDYTRSNHSLMGQDAEGCVAEFYLNYAEYLDPTLTHNRRKFIFSTLKPVSLGANGSTPTGVSPIVYFRGDETDFIVNRGTGGAFSKVGTPVDCAASPSD